jgi:chemotaxis protein methyltransferase WspC
MYQEKIANLLREKMGLNAMTIGVHSLERLIKQRVKENHLSDIADYFFLLQTSPEELEELIETVIVPETWFFRDREPFVLLKEYIMKEWMPKNIGKVLRVLSIPCSTGEEPYSIAIALRECGLTSKNFIINGVDISKKSLEKARVGIYGDKSFRGELGDVKQKYFTPLGNKYQLEEVIKRSVNFIQGNLLDRTFSVNQLPYHIIFCRNVLIYFEQAAREQTIQMLDRLLENNGLFFVGHSETQQLLGNHWASMHHSRAFAYQKKGSFPPQKETVKTEKIEKKEIRKIERLIHTPAPISSPFPPVSSAHSPKALSVTNSPSIVSDIMMIRQLADGGKLKDAASLCETYLSQNPTNADAYVLMGQLYQAMGNEEKGEKNFQKALYLEPNHSDAIVHLILIKEYRGDRVGANLLRQRLERSRHISQS